MASLVPTALRLITPPWVDHVPAPAHDSLTPAERRSYLGLHPDSYLAITRSPEDLPPGEEWDADVALAGSRSRLDQLVGSGAFGPLARPCFYLYRLADGDHEQVGVVAGVSTREYDDGLIRIHERIRDDRAEHLATQLGGLRVQSSPIALAYRPQATIHEAILSVTSSSEAMVDFESADGVHQQVWRVEDESVGRVVTEALANEPLYLIDGHHRAAATSKLLQRSPGSDAEWILAAVFSSDDLRTEAFHRLLPGTDGDQLLSRLRERLDVRAAAGPAEVVGRRADELALLVPGPSGERRWHLVTLPELASHGSEAEHFLAGLEPVRLEREILEPLDTHRHAGHRIGYRHGSGDHDDLRRLEADAIDPVWVMRPITVETVMAASDLGAVMPPKSTYFRPKVRSGVFLRPLETTI